MYSDRAETLLPYTLLTDSYLVFTELHFWQELQTRCYKMLLCSSHILTIEGWVHFAIRTDDIAITVTLLLLYCIHSVHVLGPDRERTLGKQSVLPVSTSARSMCVLVVLWLLRLPGFCETRVQTGVQFPVEAPTF